MMKLRLWFVASLAHFRAHWSSRSNFWSGILGMIVNNCLALGTIWAMLFAGRPELSDDSYAYACMTLVNMSGWGVIHIFLGGWTDLHQQIESGALDTALLTPRGPLAVSSIANSYLPAWGDLIMGVVGIAFLAAWKFGALFFVHGLLMIGFASLAFAGIFIAVGSIAFWARRADKIWSPVMMMVISFNSYPVFDSLGDPLKWLVLFAPLTAIGVIPSRFLLAPDLEILAAECAAAGFLALGGWILFRRGLRRYQSTPSFNGHRV